METITGFILCLFVVILHFSRPVSLCPPSTQPLLLTPYLDKNEAHTARKLSRVDSSCVEDFVPESYAGFITSNRQLGHHLFFWFFPSKRNESAPVLLWLNGGPTVSSMIGLFWEHGPMEISNSPNSDKKYFKRDYSWADSFSMIYLDNPIGVGFSFSDNEDDIYNVSQQGYVNNMYSFLKQFFKLFPGHKSSPLYVGGQSYAGKYVTALAHHIHTKIRTSGCDLALTGIYLGAPFYDPDTQGPAHYDYLYSMGVISHKQWHDSRRKAIALFEDNKMTPEKLTTETLTNTIFKFTAIGPLDNYVTRQEVNYKGITSLMMSLRDAVHAGGRNFNGSNFLIYSKFGADWVLSTKYEMAELLNNYKVLVYNGDYDVVVSSQMIEAALLTTPWKHQKQYNNTERKFWYRDDVNYDKEYPVGFYSSTHNLCRVVIHGAGHQVPHDSPQLAFVMMHQFITYGCLSNFSSGIISSASTSSSALKSYNLYNSLLVFEVLLPSYAFLRYLMGR